MNEEITTKEHEEIIDEKLHQEAQNDYLSDYFGDPIGELNQITDNLFPKI